MSGQQRNRAWFHLSEMLEATSEGHGAARHLDGYQIVKPNLTVPSDRGAVRQLSWAIENWIQPYLNRVRAGIDYDPTLHRPPTEPDWRTDRGRGNLPTRLAIPYGDDWESWWHRKGKHLKAARKKAARRRARD